MDSDYALPSHMRCSAHTLNLVATTDADKALASDPDYKRSCKSVFAKAQELWNKQSRYCFIGILLITIVYFFKKLKPNVKFDRFLYYTLLYTEENLG